MVYLQDFKTVGMNASLLVQFSLYLIGILQQASSATLPGSLIEQCGTLQYETCHYGYNNEIGKEDSCKTLSVQIDDQSISQQKKLNPQKFANVTNVISVSTSMDRDCRVIFCDDEELMGHCAYFQSDGKTKEMSEFTNILESGFGSASCTCKNNVTADDDHFDRNYVGVTYSPYDKYWEPTGPNGTLKPVSWQNYSNDEIWESLKLISTKFSYIATYGMGTASNTSEWDQGDKIAFVAPLAAKINANHGYPALRVSLGIFRKDDIRLEWKSKELYNAIEAAKVANSIFNGTVWGVTVTSEYVTNTGTAQDAIGMINEVKFINERENLRLKVGIRLGSEVCSKFLARKRPEDDTMHPPYQQESVYVAVPLFQSHLHQVVNISDFIFCLHHPSPNDALLPMPAMLRKMQSEFIQLRQALHKINPKLRLIIETGIPSQGSGNGFRNSLRNLRDYWYGMAEFAKKEKMMIHMFEAIDQPWKNVETAVDRHDINGPNGTDAHHGWWKRDGNSQPPVYIEKISEIPKWKLEFPLLSWFQNASFLVKGLFLGFCALVMSTLISIGYLRWKLREARGKIISKAYINQFHSGVDSKDTNYAVALRIPYHKKYELPKENFEIDKKTVLGSGQFGTILHGTVQGFPVAFKCTTPDSTVVGIKAIMSEIKILSYIGQHENLVCILGAYTKKIDRGIVCMALEYCPLGNLETFLRQTASRSNSIHSGTFSEDPKDDSSLYSTSMGDAGYLSAEDFNYVQATFQGQHPSYIRLSSTAVPIFENDMRNHVHVPVPNPDPQIDMTRFIRWSHQIASAMEFVSAKQVVHADLAARNILLASIDQVKVSDFGLSRKLYQELGVTHDKDTPLPWRWMAPESLKHLAFSVESDVWAYGVTIWEIFSMAEAPYHGISYDMQFVKELEKGMRLPPAQYATAQIHNKLLHCWNESPSTRPSFSQLKQFFLDLSTPNS